MKFEMSEKETTEIVKAIMEMKPQPEERERVIVEEKKPPTLSEEIKNLLEVMKDAEIEQETKEQALVAFIHTQQRRSWP